MSKGWKKKAIELMYTTEMSWRQIAKEIGKPRSTVSDYLRKFKKNPELVQEVIVPENRPKILLFDIETSLIKGYFWGLWKQNISINQIIEDWYVLCWSAKWLGQGGVFNDSIHLHEDALFKNNERWVVESLWQLLDEADVVVAYNGKSFDKKKMNTKFFQYGLPEPSPYKVVDPMLIIKGNFAMTSNKMDFIAKYIEDNEEAKHSTNIQLWIDCMENSGSAMDKMLDYCDQDIVVLEAVYLAVRHWDKNSPQLAMYYDDDKPRCNSCGSDDLEVLENKHAHTNLSKFGIVRCNNCSKIMRDRTNQLSKEKRKSLHMNVR